MKTLNLITLTVAAAAALSFTSMARADLAGSGNPHNFSGETWNTVTKDPHTVCGVCHTPHHADHNAGPLWNHDATASVFKMYNNANSPNAALKATTESAPAAASLACLSCHDGTVAVNAYGGSARTSIPGITNSAIIAEGGTDLSHSHPISFAYNTALAVSNPHLKDPSSTVLIPATSANGTFNTVGDMSINNFLLGGQGRVECTSCHDVHGQDGTAFDVTLNPKLVKIVGVDGNGAGSLLCRSCHKQ
jgi:hypothetical protein